MLKSLQQLVYLLSPAERVRAVLVLGAMFVMGVLQMLGVGVILPFVSLIANPGYIYQSSVLNWLYQTFGFQSANSFLVLIGAILLVVLVGSNIFTMLTIWWMTHFSWNVQRRLSMRLLDGYLHQPYEVFLNRNSADTGKNILYESQQFANNLLIPLLKTCAFGISALMIIGFLFWLQPLIALVVLGIFGGAYFLIYMTIRRLLFRIGQTRMQANTQRFQTVDEAFGSVKEVKILNREACFLDRFGPAAKVFSKAMSGQQVLGQLPRYAIEGLGFGAVMVAAIILLASGYNLVKALPLASAFVLGGYRLLPALQNIYVGITQWRFNQSVLDTLEKDLVNYRLAKKPNTNSDIDQQPNEKRLEFEKDITVSNLSFSYPNALSPALENISLSIAKNSFIAITGETGSGKTTFVDIILGLLQPRAGQIEIDNVPLTSANLALWQANLGYVPQEIYLTDSTIANNIAYGLPKEQIDMQAVQRAARIANIDDFITGKLPDGYNSVVGERGVRLSGGQRQRIGIARALYHDPSVIVLDEATSALDNETERRIVNELDAMRGGRTLIVIAHRLTTVQKCDQVFLFKEGKLTASGSYDELIEKSAEFENLAGAGEL